MEEIKFSKQLDKMIDEKDKNGIEALINIQEKIEDFFATTSCDEAIRESIKDKETILVNKLEEIRKVKSMHISNEEKKSKIHKILNAETISEILAEISSEIEVVKSFMMSKVKEASDILKDEITKTDIRFSDLIDDSMKWEEEKIEEATDRKNEILKSEKDKAQEEKEAQNEENSLVAYEGNGFWKNFKEIRNQVKDGSTKKNGIFKSLIEAYKKTKIEREEMYVAEEKELDSNPEIQRLENEMNEMDNKIAESKKNIAKLKEQKKEVKKQLLEYTEKEVKEIKDRYEKSTKAQSKETIVCVK